MMGHVSAVMIALKFLWVGYKLSFVLLAVCSYMNSKGKLVCVSSLRQGCVLVCGTVVYIVNW